MGSCFSSNTNNYCNQYGFENIDDINMYEILENQKIKKRKVYGLSSFKYSICVTQLTFIDEPKILTWYGEFPKEIDDNMDLNILYKWIDGNYKVLQVYVIEDNKLYTCY